MSEINHSFSGPSEWLVPSEWVRTTEDIGFSKSTMLCYRCGSLRFGQFGEKERALGCPKCRDNLVTKIKDHLKETIDSLFFILPPDPLSDASCDNSLGDLERCVVEAVVEHDKPAGSGRKDIERAIRALQMLLEIRYSVDSADSKP